jgi:spore maturation protein CgeB
VAASFHIFIIQFVLFLDKRDLKQKYYQEQAGDPCCPYSANSTLT